MTTLPGAIAYKASLARQITDFASATKIFQHFEGSAQSPIVECPRCGEQYVLVEDVNASEQLREQDHRFLVKSLEGAHPLHTPCVVVRDPDGQLQESCSQLSAALAKKVA